jgi:hypothetical protein
MGLDAMEQLSSQSLEENFDILPGQGLQHARKQPNFFYILKRVSQVKL